MEMSAQASEYSWMAGAGGMVEVSAFLGGFSASVIAIIAFTLHSQYESLPILVIFALAFCSLAFIFFAKAAEDYTTAIDYKCVQMYVKAIFIYNLAVVFLFWGIAVALISISLWYISLITLLGSWRWLRDLYKDWRYPEERIRKLTQTQKETCMREGKMYHKMGSKEILKHILCLE